jgi:hypothetical protein
LRTLEQLLDELDKLKKPAGPRGRSRLRSLLAQLRRSKFQSATSLIRFHEALLFMRAYPPGPALMKQTDSILRSFEDLVANLLESGPDDLEQFEEPEVSGIAGTSFGAIFSYDIARWLAESQGSRVRTDWENHDRQEQLAAVVQLLIPMLDENAYVDNFFSLEDWIRASRGRERDLRWLTRGFERLSMDEKAKAVLFDSLKLAVRWELGNSTATRTRTRRRVRKIFFHEATLLSRRDVSLASELGTRERLPIERLSPGEGQRVLEMGRETMSVRYRELYGFTFGDPRSMKRADVGRGVEIFIWGVPAERRFPTIAYHAMLILKNGIPCGYAEGLTLFERTEVGLNIFYTFRDGESAWVYARVLRVMRQELGALVFSAEPYQLGFHNQEGIDSGAFWFYRKLGFRPIVPRLAKLVQSEERKIEKRPGYRSSERTLRELATGHVLYEAPSAARGEWDRFHMRNLGLTAARQVGAQHEGDAERARSRSTKQVERSLGLDTSEWNNDERKALEGLSLVLALIPDLPRWSDEEKGAVARITRAKSGSDETRYLRLMQKHSRLRRAIIELGSK